VNYLLDTNILIYLIKNRPPAIAEKVDALLEEDTLSMSFITWAELLKGAERSTRKVDVLHRLDALARQVRVIYPTGPGICRHYATQFTRLKDAGTPVATVAGPPQDGGAPPRGVGAKQAGANTLSANDLWIACHALAVDATLVTHNLREFERVEGLRLEDWVG
jgi:tRNA(fMet)-specific endonuclease VapC